MHAIDFIEDLAIIMLIAGIISILFHRLKQPVVLGYMIAGIIIGPNTPPFSFIHDEQTIKTLAQLGVVFLMFSLGLKFSFRNLSKVGIAATFTALCEIILMLWVGYEIGKIFNWRTIDSIFLGAILAISSTTIIVKALQDLGFNKEEFVQLIYGILIVEDILAIAILAILSSFAIGGTVEFSGVLITLGKLAIFLIVTLVIGILTIPKFLSYVAKFKNQEILLITVLGLCFGFCLLVIKFQYSVALGAFVIGAIMAESKPLKKIEALISPIRDMFSAIFFVSVGLLLNPAVVVEYAFPILIITLAVIVGKILSCSLGSLLMGKEGKTSLKVGMGLAQIGEFSFIIASLGVTLQVTSYFLFPIAVAVSVLTTFLTPYFIKWSDPLAEKIANRIPERTMYIFNMYRNWLAYITPQMPQSELRHVIRQSIFQISINLSLVTAIFLIGSYFSPQIKINHTIPVDIQKTIIWGGLFIISLPFLIAIYRRVKGLSVYLAEIGVRHERVGEYTEPVRRVIAEIIPAVTITAILIFLIFLSASILPPPLLFILILLFALLISAFLRRWFIRIHAKLQIALREALERKPPTDSKNS